MSEHPIDVLREALEDYWANHEPVTSNLGGRGLAALRAVEQLVETMREQGEPVMDARFRDRLLRHVLSNEEVAQLVDAIESREARALAALALFDRKEQT